MIVSRISSALRPAIFSTCILALTAQQAFADTTVFVEGPQAKVTVDDVQADSLRMPEEMRASVLSRAQTVQQIGTNLYVRRVMAENASKQGLDKATEVQSALAVARDKILSDAYLAQMDKKNTVSTSALEAQARAIYQANTDRFKTPDQIRIRHILVDSKEPGARAKAEGLLAQLRSGADFVELAKANSIDQGTASKGGDLGFFARGRMLPEFESAAFAMVKPGEFSPIVETKFGFHILQLEEKRAAGIQPFAEVKDGLVKEIQTKVTQDARVAEAQAIVESAKINSAAIEAYSKSFPTSGK